MRCPLCGIEMRVQARGEPEHGKTLLRFACRNKACSNHTPPPPKTGEDDNPKIVAERMVDT